MVCARVNKSLCAAGFARIDIVPGVLTLRSAGAPLALHLPASLRLSLRVGERVKLSA